MIMNFVWKLLKYVGEKMQMLWISTTELLEIANSVGKWASFNNI
jgi:hypothetical protein